jgi:lipid A 3-O-deacylase
MRPSASSVAEKALRACACICLFAACSSDADQATNREDSWWTLNAASQATSSSHIWPDGIGNGLREDVHEVAFDIGLATGTRELGGWLYHDLALARISYARLRTGVIGGQCLLRGSLEARIELLAGGQYSPESAYLVGLTPSLRYNLATGTRWMPFASVGAGVSLTDIGLPDLSTVFEFNLQFGGGCSYFLTDDLALTVEYRHIHFSNANIDTPNPGVNVNFFSIGLSRYF